MRVAGGRGLLLGLLGLAVSAAGMAQAGGPILRVDLQVGREVVEPGGGGGEAARTVAVETASVGDVLVYQLRITNEGDEPAVAARVVDPVPDGTVLLPGTVDGEGAQVSFSADGGETYDAYPLTRLVRGEDGTEAEVPIPDTDYTHVRWSLGGALLPGETRTANFKVRVR